LVAPAYVPDRGDFVWLSFDPQAGREQAGQRPAIVLTPLAFNRATNLAMVCPITRQAKGYRFEVSLPDDLAVSGVVLADHASTFDWKARRAEFAGSAPEDVTNAVIARVRRLLE
jgi:mRNA interferase MazF